MAGPFTLDGDAWAAWRPERVAAQLAGVETPWYVAAGWAIDLFLGGERREHEDLEIAVPAVRFHEIAAALDGYEIAVIGTPEQGLATPYDEAGEEALAETHQTWIREPATGLWRLDVFREPSEGDIWVCRRDERLRLPYDRVIERTADGIPFGRPEIVLLFKARHARPKDDDDLAAVLPHLDGGRRAWLREAFELVHPGHRWLSRLE